jgi:hypothetical protein
MNAILEKLGENLTAVLITTVVGVLTACSGYIVEWVKTGLNRANLRTERYTTLATDLSNHVFSAELQQEFLEHNWTSEPTLKSLVDEYNTSITKLRRCEYVYYQWLSRYWGTEAMAEFEEIMKLVKQIDGVIHGLNDQFELVGITKSQPKVDETLAKQTAAALKPLVECLTKRTKAFLTRTR